jgi:hypothetical protein
MTHYLKNFVVITEEKNTEIYKIEIFDYFFNFKVQII